MKQPKKISRHKGAIAWMAGNSVAANILMLSLIIGGILVGPRIKQEVFPEFDLGFVSISVSYPGASPEEVESGIILSIEEALQSVEGISEVSSTANEGSARIQIEALEGIDLNRLSREIESEVDAISSFPEDAESPRVVIASRRRDVINFAIHGNVGEKVLREKAEEIRDELLSDPRITQVELDGIRDYEISVDVPMETLRRYRLTLGEIASIIKNSSIDLPGGSLKTRGGEILVRMKERKEFAREYGDIPIITHSDGSRTLLRDIATIREGFEDSDRASLFNGEPAIMVDVYRVENQKPIEIAETARELIDDIQKGLPKGLSISVVRDMSDLFRQRAELLTRNAYIGLALVFCLLALFLEFRLAFWVSLGIPASILGAFLILPLFGFTINVISMFAFIVTLGIVVDDAIVVGENIFYNRQAGMSYMDAAIHGAREIAMPVTFSILTNIVAFMPLFFVPGFMGKVFFMIPSVVITVLSISLIESLFVLPAHLGHQKSLKEIRFFTPVINWQKRFSHAFASFVENRYGTVVKLALEHRYTTLAIAISVFVITAAYITSGRMGMDLFPTVESDYAYVKVILPYGSPAWKTREVQNRVITAAKKVIRENGGRDLSRGILTRIDENDFSARIYLTPPDERPISTKVVTELWRKEAGQIPGVESVLFLSDRGGPGSGKGVTIQLSHRDTAILTAASEHLAAEISEFPNTSDIDDGSASGKLQYDFSMLPEGERLGFRAADVARQVRNALYGAEARKILRERNEVKIMIRLPEHERITDHTLEKMILISPTGVEAPLQEIVSQVTGRAYTSINRIDGKRISQVTANVTPRAKANLLIGELKKTALPELMQKYPGLSYSLEGRQAQMRESMESLKNGLLMALLVIYCILAIPLRSYFQPLLIMSCIPFGLVGATIGHVLLGYSLSVISMFGLVALSGVVVNDSLVLIDFANRKRKSGLEPVQAVHAAGIHRFRPILLTTLTTFGGLSPMIFETSRQARFLIPMAVSLGFGIVFATLITLILVPVLYMILEDIIGLTNNIFGGFISKGLHEE